MRAAEFYIVLVGNSRGGETAGQAFWTIHDHPEPETPAGGWSRWSKGKNGR